MDVIGWMFKSSGLLLETLQNIVEYITTPISLLMPTSFASIVTSVLYLFGGLDVVQRVMFMTISDLMLTSAGVFFVMRFVLFKWFLGR